MLPLGGAFLMDLTRSQGRRQPYYLPICRTVRLAHQLFVSLVKAFFLKSSCPLVLLLL
jgi:hypothetical protein